MHINQFDVFQNPIAKSRADYPYVCVLQNDLYRDLSSCLVAFVTHNETLALERLSVTIKDNSEYYYVSTNVMFTIEASRLNKFMFNVSDQRDELLNAYDALFTGI
ncbi:CcdB family protein [Alteromonas sp. LMIT006]|jgi:hypothetical protein|uniref:CcdB family protein n=1 Tax=Alteromonadaceae TaxID=72275 RepID=UPI0020CA2DA9|nr:CcdB family protein [Alteromonas sp. LMIT006]UTP72284.1 CcdB family protein [Alteromonas sp. LMIT006]